MKCILTGIPIAKVGSNNGLEKIMQNLGCSKILSFECSKYEMKGGRGYLRENLIQYCGLINSVL